MMEISRVLGTQGSADVFRVNQAAPVHRNVGYFAAFTLQMLAGVQNRANADGQADHVVARPGQPEQGQIVGLGTAAGKDNLRRASPQQRGSPLPRARSTAAPVCWPWWWIDEALPNSSAK